MKAIFYIAATGTGMAFLTVMLTGIFAMIFGA